MFTPLVVLFIYRFEDEDGKFEQPLFAEIQYCPEAPEGWVTPEGKETMQIKVDRIGCVNEGGINYIPKDLMGIIIEDKDAVEQIFARVMDHMMSKAE